MSVTGTLVVVAVIGSVVVPLVNATVVTAVGVVHVVDVVHDFVDGCVPLSCAVVGDAAWVVVVDASCGSHVATPLVVVGGSRVVADAGCVVVAVAVGDVRCSVARVFRAVSASRGYEGGLGHLGTPCVQGRFRATVRETWGICRANTNIKILRRKG